MSSRGRLAGTERRMKTAAPTSARTAMMSLTYSVQRQSRYSVSRPPSIRPVAAPEPATAPKTPNALARSLALVNVVVSSDSADGASRAANSPWTVRATTSMVRLWAAPPTADVRESRRHRPPPIWHPGPHGKTSGDRIRGGCSSPAGPAVAAHVWAAAAVDGPSVAPDQPAAARRPTRWRP
jgi:hypothetical protein